MENLQIKQRTALQFLVQSGRNRQQCLLELRNVYGDDTMHATAFYKWYKRFSEGRKEVEDDPRAGRPTVINEKSISAVKAVVDLDRRVSHRVVAEMTGLSKGTVMEILHSHLHMRKVVARWVPHSLTEHQMQNRSQACARLLTMYRRHGRRVIGRIITGDETWVHHYEPESKRESMQWIEKGDPSPTKFKAKRSMGKVLYIVFWDVDGIILLHQVPAGQTVNAKYYSNCLLTSLASALRTKRPHLRHSSILFQHDNAPCHTANLTTETLENLGWELLEHPPYSPDIAPSDYHLFSNLKAYMRGRRFESRAALGSAVYQWSKTLQRDWFYSGMMKLPSLWQKCIDASGAYFVP